MRHLFDHSESVEVVLLKIKKKSKNTCFALGQELEKFLKNDSIVVNYQCQNVFYLFFLGFWPWVKKRGIKVYVKKFSTKKNSWAYL